MAEKGDAPNIVIYAYPSLATMHVLRGGTEREYAYVDFKFVHLCIYVYYFNSYLYLETTEYNLKKKIFKQISSNNLISIFFATYLYP